MLNSWCHRPYFRHVVQLFLFSISLFSFGVYAQTITYTVSQISPTEYEYRYTLTNDSTDPISEFLILFDETLYDNLSEMSRPAGWDSLIFPPDIGLGDPGEYNAFVTGPALAVGDSAGEFVIRFEWLGTGEPGDQSFSIIDPATFNSIFDGTTSAVPTSNNTAPASIPSTTLLGLFSLLVLCFGFALSQLSNRVKNI